MIIFGPSFLLLIPAMLFAGWAQLKVRSAYAKYSEVGTRNGLSGADVAVRILQDAGVNGCSLEMISGEMTDHYDPRDHTLRLSSGVYSGRSIAALGIAAHEVGHAIQHAHDYGPLGIRNLVYPACNIGSSLAWPLFIIGIFASSPMLQQAGIVLFSFAVFFTVLTLPVEFNASRLALRALAEGGYLADDELTGARKVLTAAALTYVAAAAMAILQLVRMLILSDRD